MLNKRFLSAIAIAISSFIAVGASELPSLEHKVDYRATTTFIGNSKRPAPSAILLSHAGWTKWIESGADASVTFQKADETLALTISRSKGQLAGLRLRRDMPNTAFVAEVTDTGLDRTIAGETCRMWRIYHGDRNQLGFRMDWFKCLTVDGIELASGAFDRNGQVSTSTQVTRFERKPVAWSEVLPANDLIAQTAWLSDRFNATRTGARPADFEMKMQGLDGEQVLRRRHFPWNYERVINRNGGQIFRIWSESADAGIILTIDSNDRITNVNARNQPLPNQTMGNTFDLVTEPKKTSRSEVILNERCTWFDMSPNVDDADQLQCQTDDGIPLQITHTSGWGPGSVYIATEVSRIAQHKDNFVVPIALWSLKKWGFPEVP